MPCVDLRDSLILIRTVLSTCNKRFRGGFGEFSKFPGGSTVIKTSDLCSEDVLPSANVRPPGSEALRDTNPATV